MTVKHVWLDCDPGHDDAMAILLAALHPGLKLHGISTVSGNMPLAHTTRNAASLLRAAGIEGVTVYPGAARPLLAAPRHDPDIHGETGLDGTDALPAAPAELISADKAVLAMARAVAAANAAGEKLHLIATGALTNVALFLALYPELEDGLAQIVFMGGAIGIGNRSPVAEFNILCDPEAANMVIQSAVRTVMVPLEVTHTALVTEAVLQPLRDMNSTFGKMLIDLLLFFRDTYERVFGFKDGPPLHDPCAVYWVLDEAAFVAPTYRVDVDTAPGSLGYGQTVVDVWRDSPNPANCVVTEKMDVPRFWASMTEAWAAANAQATIN